MDELENFSDLDNLLSLAADKDFILNPNETKFEIVNAPGDGSARSVEENDCELVSVKIGANPLSSSINSIRSFFINKFKSQANTPAKMNASKGQTSISTFFKPPKRLPDEPIEHLEVKKMPKITEKPFVFPSPKNPTNTLNLPDLADQKNTNGKKYKLPKFKLIPGTPFAVDAFSYGPIGGITGYFLTHFHSDHYKGLSNKLFIERAGVRLYCSEVTRNLVRKELSIREEFITTLKIGQIYIIEGIHVGLLDANQ